MKNAMMSVEEAASRIRDGAVLLVAGSETALRQLPQGRWIGGTSVYFLTETGGRCDIENLFVTEFDSQKAARICYHDAESIEEICSDRFENGASAILIPAFSNAHQRFAVEGATYPGLFDQPLFGWVTGTHLDEIGQRRPKIVDGTTGALYDDGAILLHLEMPDDFVADLDIVNLFTQDADSDIVVFDTDGFSASKAWVNGKEVSFGKYIEEAGINTQLPLVADYAGALINVAFQSLDADTGEVQFYAPVMKGVEYRIAKSPGDYAEAFARRIDEQVSEQFSCNCILNYVYGGLEGKKTGGFTGPATFGEIAYILLNQTLVHLKFEAAEAVKVA